MWSYLNRTLQIVKLESESFNHRSPLVRYPKAEAHNTSFSISLPPWRSIWSSLMSPRMPFIVTIVNILCKILNGFRFMQWFNVDIDSALGSLFHVDVGSVARSSLKMGVACISRMWVTLPIAIQCKDTTVESASILYYNIRKTSTLFLMFNDTSLTFQSFSKSINGLILLLLKYLTPWWE